MTRLVGWKVSAVNAFHMLQEPSQNLRAYKSDGGVCPNKFWEGYQNAAKEHGKFNKLTPDSKQQSFLTT